MLREQVSDVSVKAFCDLMGKTMSAGDNFKLVEQFYEKQQPEFLSRLLTCDR
jgi:hypothetical protein